MTWPMRKFIISQIKRSHKALQAWSIRKLQDVSTDPRSHRLSALPAWVCWLMVLTVTEGLLAAHLHTPTSKSNRQTKPCLSFGLFIMLPACPWDLLNESCHYPPLPPDDPPKPTHYPCSPGSSGIPNTLHTQSLAPGHKEIEPGSCSEIG